MLPIANSARVYLYKIRLLVVADTPTFHLAGRVPQNGRLGSRQTKINAKLCKKSKGVARRSRHMQGQALDFRLPGTETAVLRDTARTMKRGGVGYYKKSDFIQIDTGRVRNW